MERDKLFFICPNRSHNLAPKFETLSIPRCVVGMLFRPKFLPPPKSQASVAVFDDGTSDSYWNRLTRRKKQMIFRSICFQVIKAVPLKYFFCSYFKLIHDFIKYKSTLPRSGIISKVCKFRTIVLQKITKIYVNPTQDKPFSGCSRMRGGQKDPLPKICHTFYCDEIWHNYTLRREDVKNI